MPLKAWVKNALDQVIQVCLKEPELEFAWVGDDAVDPLQQAQTLSLLVGAGIKTREEARAELGLAGAAKRVAKYNHNHDEQGRFTTPENAVEPGTHAKPDSGVEVADDEYSPTMTDAGGGETTVAPTSSTETNLVSRPEVANITCDHLFVLDMRICVKLGEDDPWLHKQCMTNAIARFDACVGGHEIPDLVAY